MERQFEVRLADLSSDLPVLRAMMNAYMLEFDATSDPALYWDDAYFQACASGVSAGTLRILFACDGAVPLGFVIGRVEQMWYRPTTRLGHVEELYVAPSHRRRGVAKALVSSLRQWFRELKIDTISASVHHLNPTALYFWQHSGFEVRIYHLFSLA
jgi:GNAT superfamily N-acetyltransferase